MSHFEDRKVGILTRIAVWFLDRIINTPDAVIKHVEADSAAAEVNYRNYCADPHKAEEDQWVVMYVLNWRMLQKGFDYHGR